MFDWTLLIPLVGVSIPLAAILANPLNRWIKMKERALELAATTAGEQAAQYAAKIERLESRVAVLERIAVDPGHALGQEIEKLRTLPLN